MDDAIVVGAGPAGLAASWHLRRRGVGHVVLERGGVGETWRTQRWDSFTLNTPTWMSRLPGVGAAPGAGVGAAPTAGANSGIGDPGPADGSSRATRGSPIWGATPGRSSSRCGPGPR